MKLAIRMRPAAVLGTVAVAVTLAGCGALSAPRLAVPAAIAPGGAQAGFQADSQPGAQVGNQVSGGTRALISKSRLLKPAGKYFGVEATGAPESIAPVQTFAATAGRYPNMVGQYVAWQTSFDATAAANAVNYGALYYMVWEPYGVTVRSIADGASDAYIKNFAQAARAFGQPVALSFGHEMNGNWYPWGTTGTGATAADFVAAWRHIHDLFAQAGASNVIWVWDPNDISPVPNVQLEPYWPGSAYVDWVGITGYLAITGPQNFDALYDPTMAELSQFTGTKPFIIAETSVETGPAELSEIQSLVNGVKEHSNVLGLVWFNYVKANIDWTLTDRAKARATFASLIAGMPLASVSK
jgi:hypothetical protein